ncbi:MAG TPA: DUF899 family protein [Gammaproteobacteria bacterium]|nr:DUF899 family protein [Gammaproteobacteria bacterium]
MTEVRFPNESDEYRNARNELLDAEKDLRSHIEQVAGLRRNLPKGGILKEDYVFEEYVDGKVREIKLSDLFGSAKDTLFVYSFMYAPDMDTACPMCTALLDGLDGQVRHLEQSISTAVVAKHDSKTLDQYAASRGWQFLRLVSSRNNSYNVDYFGEVDGQQTTTANVFVRDSSGIRHFWNSELSYQPMMMEGAHMRHLDLIWPLWNVLDMTPFGRGDFFPSLEY